MRDRLLLVIVEVDCSNCGGTGRWVDGGECGDCGGSGQVESRRRVTPADLLTDPRVLALVEALRLVVGYLYGRLLDSAYAQVLAALAPFEEVRRG